MGREFIIGYEAKSLWLNKKCCNVGHREAEFNADMAYAVGFKLTLSRFLNSSMSFGGKTSIAKKETKSWYWCGSEAIR